MTALGGASPVRREAVNLCMMRDNENYRSVTGKITSFWLE
jgi:hypothetical protein